MLEVICTCSQLGDGILSSPGGGDRMFECEVGGVGS